MSFEFQITLGDILTITTICITLLLFLSSRASANKINRAQFMHNYYIQFYQDKEISSVFIDIDYDRFKFNVDDLGTENEIKIWKILDLLNNIGFHCKNKTIKIEDIKANTFGYAIIQVYRNQEIQKYLSHLDKHTDSVEGNLAAFDNFRLIAKKLLNS